MGIWWWYGGATGGRAGRALPPEHLPCSSSVAGVPHCRLIITLTIVMTAGAAAALSDMPPRQEHELDPVTLHNQALVALAMAEAGGGQAAHGRRAALAKLLHLLAHPPFPPELAGNLLSLCCRPQAFTASSGNGSMGSAEECAAVAEKLLGGHAALVAEHVPPGLLPLYEACLARVRQGPTEAAAKLDELAGVHIEGLRKRVKAVQDARWAGDHAAAAAGLEAYEADLGAYIPGVYAH